MGKKSENASMRENIGVQEDKVVSAEGIEPSTY